MTTYPPSGVSSKLVSSLAMAPVNLNIHKYKSAPKVRTHTYAYVKCSLNNNNV